MSGKYDDRLGLFPNKHRRGDNDPHFQGSVTLSVETLKELVEMARAGKEPRLGASAWVNDWEGKKRISVTIRPWVEREDNRREQVDPFAGDKPAEDNFPF